MWPIHKVKKRRFSSLTTTDDFYAKSGSDIVISKCGVIGNRENVSYHYYLDTVRLLELEPCRKCFPDGLPENYE